MPVNIPKYWLKDDSQSAQANCVPKEQRSKNYDLAKYVARLESNRTPLRYSKFKR